MASASSLSRRTSPSAGRSRPSIFRRFSYTVGGRWLTAGASSHLSSSWPTVALVRLNLPASSSATRGDRALPAAFPVPWNERVAWRGLAWLAADRIAADESPQHPVSRRPLPHGARLALRACCTGHARQPTPIWTLVGHL